MNSIEKELLNILNILKENYFVTGVKAEFEAEGASYDEIFRLKELSYNAGLDLTIKIGGCEAVTDLYLAKQLGANSIVAPMIESEYAVKKFELALKRVYTNRELVNLTKYINIETITGYEKLNEITACESFSGINGIVFGRADMTKSLGLEKEFADSPKLFECAQNISKVMENNKKEMIIGGGISTNSIDFLNSLHYLTKFETRKIIFNANNNLTNENLAEGIKKAIEFEIKWLNNKSDYNTVTEQDKKRITFLKQIYLNAGKAM